MPTLILSASYNTDSKILRSAAQKLKWETFRFAGANLPADYELKNAPYAIYCTVPNALSAAKKLDSILLGCSSEWLPNLPESCLKRRIELLQLKDADKLQEIHFIKPALGKSFDASIKTRPQLAFQTSHLPPDLLLHVSEIVKWEAEYRCFIREDQVTTLSPYRLGATTFSSYATPLQGSRSELDAAREFATFVLKSAPCPRAFVLDVGIIKGKGWAVIEPNECWGSGIYGCSPEKILEVLLAAVIPKRVATTEDLRWNYTNHYFRACPHMKDPQNW